jgi:mxaJ protein
MPLMRVHESQRAGRLWPALPAALLLVLAGIVASPESARADDVLRVCADPNSLPFSNRAEAGFENELARLVAGALGKRLEYFWWAQRRGYIRNTLRAQRCDVVMAAPAGADRLLTTQPYYRSSYVFVRRRGMPALRTLDDPALRTLKVGVQLIGDEAANAPPAHSLAQRGIIDNVVGFMVYGDYASTDPERPIIDAVASGAIDVAIVWGPLAGYYASRSAVPLELTPVAPLVDGVVRLSFAISMGVRRTDAALRAELDAVLDRNRAQVAAILERYGVPRLEVTR